ncbi:uncharacterized protein LOC134767079 [Penaeus indicus]|uniref:uncharacterized protein LOC134767079 n=1 Tax=Penaeus indicus TaxID=29960 RepID=UPI00300C8B5E
MNRSHYRPQSYSKLLTIIARKRHPPKEVTGQPPGLASLPRRRRSELPLMRQVIQPHRRRYQTLIKHPERYLSPCGMATEGGLLPRLEHSLSVLVAAESREATMETHSSIAGSEERMKSSDHEQDPPSATRDSTKPSSPSGNPDEDGVGRLERNTKARRITQYLAATAACLGATCSGAVMGFSAPAGPQLIQNASVSLHNDSNALMLTRLEYSWFSSLPNLAAAVVGPLAGLAMNKIGRRGTMLASDCTRFDGARTS